MNVAQAKIEELQQHIRTEEKNLQQCILKLQSIEACCLLYDSNVTDCEKTLIFLVKSLKVAQDLVSMLVEQLAQMKLGVGLYFEPLPQLRPSTPS